MPTTEKEQITQQLLDAFAKDYVGWNKYCNSVGNEEQHGAFLITQLEELASLASDLVMKERIEHSLIVEKTKDYYQRKCDSLNLDLFNLKDSSQKTAQAIFSELEKKAMINIDDEEGKIYSVVIDKDKLEEIRAKYLKPAENGKVATPKQGGEGK